MIREFVRGTARESAIKALERKARDETAHVADRSCLILAPHPDDESLGCGGVIAAKRAAGSDVTVVIATSGGSGQPVELIEPKKLAEVRKSEALDACSILGVSDDRVFFWDFPTKQLSRNIEEAERRLVNVIDSQLPDEIYVTSALDHNLDHRALNEIAVRALRQAGTKAELIEYPIWFWMSVPWFYHIDTPGGRLGRIVGQPLAMLRRLEPISVDISPVLETKVAAIQAHTSQVTGLSDDPRWKNLPGHLLRMTTQPTEMYFPIELDHRRGRFLEGPALPEESVT